MASYIVSTVVIKDSAKFGEYAKGIAGLSEEFGGEYIVRGPAAAALEGDFIDGERVVVAKFPDSESARAYLSDPRYLSAKTKREGSAEVRMLLIED